jgi:murein DD-endopeptidase MepM/ murein hydrolase activator NlpD
MINVKAPSLFASLFCLIYVSIAILLPSGYVLAQTPAPNPQEDYMGEEQEKIIESGSKYFDFVEFDPCGAASGASFGGGTVDAGFSLGSGDAERRANLVKALMNDYGLTTAQASGIVGNFMHESGGKHVPPDVNEGGRIGPPLFDGGYGWAQWTGPRQETFIDFAVKNGLMASRNVNATDAANYGYLKHELDTGYKNTITQLRKQTTPENAAVSFEATFERAGVPALAERKANARQVYNEITGVSVPDPIDDGNLDPGATEVQNCPIPASAGATINGFTYPLATTKSNVGPPGIHSNGTTSRGGHPYIAFDILTKTGTPVVASLPGVVSHIGTDRCPGRLVSVYSKELNMTVSYLHMMMDIDVSEGQQVIGGQQLGRVGTLQNGCTVPHLHIDAAKGSYRPGCSRLSCSAANKSRFIDIGPELYDSFQLLPP